MEEIVKHINDTNASYRAMGAGDAKNTDLFLDNEHYDLFKDSGDQITVRYSKDNLTQAVLFIASILPRKYDNSSVHKTISFSNAFVYDQLAFLDGFFTVDGIKVGSRTQKWNARKDVLKANGDIDKRFYFNGLLEDIEYINYKGERKSAKFTIRNYFAGGYSDFHIKKANDGIFDVWITNTQTPYDDGKDKHHEIIDDQSLPLQQIFYGAPGTGKSHKIKDDENVKEANKKNLVYRTTFHPDSDYSTFVGCYKPKSHKKNLISGNSINETQLLSSFFDSNSPKYNRMNKARYLYEALVHTKDIRDLGLDAQMVADKLNAKGFSGCAYTTEATCMYNIYDWLKEDGYIVENKLSYEFTPQCFVKAYGDAWKHQQSGEPVYLIIEEINRGNCAQIFGDLFQLLDRDNKGFSRYEISPDSDLQDYISELGLSITNITDTDGNDISAKIANGDLMKLPNNLYIWATMNTSDQSLFPIDSAFKRRWEWKYIKIKEGRDENGNKLDWKVDVKMDEAGNLLPWWAFIQKINEIIASMTSSADKQLGYFFCCAKDGVINEETFVSKVIFYLWNDVFKDYGFEDASLFRYTSKDSEGKETEKDLTFPDFYDEDGEKVNTERLTDFVKKVMNWKKTSEENS